jgi:hypothetical protein
MAISSSVSPVLPKYSIALRGFLHSTALNLSLLGIDALAKELETVPQPVWAF